MTDDKSLSATEEYAEFLDDRRRVAAAEERGDVDETRAFCEKWFARYPEFNRPRRGAYRCCNDLEEYLAKRAAA